MVKRRQSINLHKKDFAKFFTQNSSPTINGANNYYSEREEFAPSWPYCCLVLGPRMSGKTQTTMQLLTMDILLWDRLFCHLSIR